MRFFATLELDLIEFGNPIDDLGDRFAEAARQFFFGDRSVFDDIVQDGRHDGVSIDSQTSQDDACGDRVGDVGLAGLSFLTFMSFGAKFGGDADALDLLCRQVALRSRQKFL